MLVLSIIALCVTATLSVLQIGYQGLVAGKVINKDGTIYNGKDELKPSTTGGVSALEQARNQLTTDQNALARAKAAKSPNATTIANLTQKIADDNLYVNYLTGTFSGSLTPTNTGDSTNPENNMNAINNPTNTGVPTTVTSGLNLSPVMLAGVGVVVVGGIVYLLARRK